MRHYVYYRDQHRCFLRYHLRETRGSDSSVHVPTGDFQNVSFPLYISATSLFVCISRFTWTSTTRIARRDVRRRIFYVRGVSEVAYLLEITEKGNKINGNVDRSYICTYISTGFKFERSKLKMFRQRSVLRVI